jgi:hypothetical protein
MMARAALATIPTTLLLLLLLSPLTSADAPPLPDSVVVLGNARFTVLTDRLVRMEYSPTAAFDDRDTLTVTSRALDASPPPFTVARPTPTTLSIATAFLTVSYEDDGSPFSDANLLVDYTVPAVCLGGGGSVTPSPPSPSPNATFAWRPSTDLSASNLGGTFRSLDCYDGPMPCAAFFTSPNFTTPGLLSRTRAVVVDDTLSPRLDDGNATDPHVTFPWFLPNATNTLTADLYLSAYACDYPAALSAFTRLSGAIAMPRRSVFGYWWSRWAEYTAATLTAEVIDGFAAHNLPLSALSIDLGWHNEPADPSCSDYANLDFNLTRYPDPPGFLRALGEGSTSLAHPVAVFLNVQPEDGVDKCDSRYAVVAGIAGVNASTGATVPCDLGSKAFVSGSFSTYFNAPPLSLAAGMWTDYLGCAGPDPVLLWANTVFENESRFNGTGTSSQTGRLRPLILSRHGGAALGTQRLPISFSGDSYQHESALSFLVGATPQASNALVPYWSHDVGGFMSDPIDAPGDADPANFTGALLLTRWFQAGALSPIMRSHCDHCLRTPWSFPDVFPFLADAIRLRQALVPYLYSLARAAFDGGMPPLRPLYYAFPGEQDAYGTAWSQYMLGPSLVASPITKIQWAGGGGGGTGGSNRTSWTVWVPPGRWTAWDWTVTAAAGASLSLVVGPQNLTLPYGFGDVPLLVPAGALLPLGSPNQTDVASTSPPLTWVLFPGLQGGASTASVYEDDGVSQLYAAAAAAPSAQAGLWQSAVASREAGDASSPLVFTIRPANGTYPGAPAGRCHALQVRPGDGWLRGDGTDAVSVDLELGSGGGAIPLTPVPAGALPPFPMAPSSSSSRGYFFVPAGGQSLLAPAGSLVVLLGEVPFSSSAVVRVRIAEGPGGGGASSSPAGSDTEEIAAVAGGSVGGLLALGLVVGGVVQMARKRGRRQGGGSRWEDAVVPPGGGPESGDGAARGNGGAV